MTIKFQSEKHERDFRDTLSKMKSKDCYHKAVAYLLTLDEVCNKHIAAADVQSMERRFN